MRHTAFVPCAGFLLAGVVGIAAHLSAQVADKRTPEQIKASFDAHKGEFDYLLGDWEFTATSRAYGKFKGYWSAVRLEKGQLLDEYSVVGDNGETYYVTTTRRNYNGGLDPLGAGWCGCGERIAGHGHRSQGRHRNARRTDLWCGQRKPLALADSLL